MPSNETAKTKSAPKKGKTGPASAAVPHKGRLDKDPGEYGWRATVRRNYKQLLVQFLLLVIICGAISLPFWVLRGNKWQTYRLTIGDSPALQRHQAYRSLLVSRPWVYDLKGVYTEADIQKGLGGTKKLEFNQGMIFLFDKTAERCFWMKDMNYSLDIIWTDSEKNITAIERDVAPSTYPDSFCHPGQFVIELNAGEADKNGLELGQLLNF